MFNNTWAALQIIINNKNQRDLFEEVEEKPGTWKLTRAGEIFVEEKLPKLSKKWQ